jgi:hypothetical protein
VSLFRSRGMSHVRRLYVGSKESRKDANPMIRKGTSSF